ncbi:DUF222 domain-containing protein [Aquihabitans sp. McL0605]|uniref:HNH endonuclease signature motif containing protein n=1 Tax=Aquihabitans sp. McL0605 TaxID=3415671 RepID=UPI003CE8D824
MTPPRTSDAADGAPVDRYDQVLEEIARLQGVINIAHGQMVDVARQAIADGVSGGDPLSPKDWVAWRTGISPERAADIVHLAERSEELPSATEALRMGLLSVDQAAEIARHVPPAYDESATRVAQCCTVQQLRQALPCYADPKLDGARKRRRGVATGVDEEGWWIRGRLPEAEGALIDRALKAKQEDLEREARTETPEGERPPHVSLADALLAQAEDDLAAAAAARPGTDRYLVHAHLQAGPHGLELMTHLGVALPEGQRRLILCDAKLRAALHHGITPVAMGRATHIVNRRLRRLVEHRDGGCAVPGCHRTTRLDVHHIIHWEDQGVTETWNLLTLCRAHHRLHHLGELGIEGNADLPRHRDGGVVFTNRHGRVLDATGEPILPDVGGAGGRARSTAAVERAAGALGIAPHRYLPPTGERLDRRQFHLNASPPLTPAGDDLLAAPPDDEPPPVSPDGSHARRGPGTDAASPITVDGPTATDPTRAGPAAG